MAASLSPAWTAVFGPGTSLVSGSPRKSAGDRKRMGMDFGDCFLLQQGFTIDSYSVAAPGLTVSSGQLDFAYQVSAIIDGGTAGITYNVTFIITLNDGDATTIKRVGTLKVT